MIRHSAPARVGILGNPSDGYGGRTLALAVPQFDATVHLDPGEGIEVQGRAEDELRWDSPAALTAHIDRYGYGSGPQLLTATIRTFIDVAESIDHELNGVPGFSLDYRTSIPRQVGLGGSSALVVAALRCLQDHYRLDLPEDVLPSVALRAETTQLGIAAGLQDRVIQCYGGLVAMDFGELTVNSRFGVGHGTYDRVDPDLLPPLFLAYREDSAESSDDYHQRLRHNYEQGDGQVRETLRELAGLVTEGRAALRWGDQETFGSLVAHNMTLRRSLGPLPPAQLELVEVAEGLGAPATFAGSGGSVVGIFDDDAHFESLCDAYADVGADSVRIDIGQSATPTDLAEKEEQGEATNVVSLDRRSK